MRESVQADRIKRRGDDITFPIFADLRLPALRPHFGALLKGALALSVSQSYRCFSQNLPSAHQKYATE
ncbi:hypothetical protein V6N11_080508 [Hibiscus sabdariffa]|uniref:Uncharacterized protein n=1 Tax=Hibiscus sabdariffa TaxID=183260 RepID=A0ABR2AFH1_9ROSI